MGSKIVLTNDATDANRRSLIQNLVRLGHGSFSPDNKTFHVTGGKTNGRLGKKQIQALESLPWVERVED